MKKLLTLCVLLPCGLVFAQYPKSEAETAKSFMSIFQKADTAALLEMLPPPSVFRLTAPEETQGKTDEEINQTIQPLRDELAMGFRYLLHEADSLMIERPKLKLIGQKANAIVNYPGFYGLTIEFAYGRKRGVFSLGTAFIGERWYIYAIDQMVGVFTDMITVKK